MSQFHLLKVSSVDRSARDTVIIHFHQPPFGRIHYLPGQYLTMRLEYQQEVHFRSYSICSAPRLDSRISIGVKRIVGGLVSSYLVDHAEPDMEFEVMEPRGRFYLDNSVKETRQIVLLGGGSGITPLYSILRSTLYNEPNSLVSLLLSNRSKEEVMFREGLEKMEVKFADRLRVEHWFSGKQGRITSDRVHAFLHDMAAAPAQKVYFVCGPEPLMQLYRAALLRAGIAEHDIHQEHFQPTTDEKFRRSLVNGHTRVVTLDLLGNRYEFPVPPGSTVLDAALDRGINLPHSCKRGNCASCLATLVNGSVVMANKDALLDFERDRGKVLTCQAQPESDDVHISFS